MGQPGAGTRDRVQLQDPRTDCPSSSRTSLHGCSWPCLHPLFGHRPQAAGAPLGQGSESTECGQRRPETQAAVEGSQAEPGGNREPEENLVGSPEEKKSDCGDGLVGSGAQTCCCPGAGGALLKILREIRVRREGYEQCGA